MILFYYNNYNSNIKIDGIINLIITIYYRVVNFYYFNFYYFFIMASHNEITFIFTFKRPSGIHGNLTCTVSSDVNRMCDINVIPLSVIKEYLSTLNGMMEDFPGVSKLEIPISDMIITTGPKMLEYFEMLKTQNYHDLDRPTFFLLSRYLGDDITANNCLKCIHYSDWDIKRIQLFPNLFWEIIYFQYISDTFWLDISETKKLRRTKIRRDMEGWASNMAFYYLFRDTYVDSHPPNHNAKKREFGHNHCMYRFLTINPDIARYILDEGDRACFVDDICISQKLRHRVKSMTYDELLDIHTTFEQQADRLSTSSNYDKIGRKVVVGGHVNGSEVYACIEQQQIETYRIAQSKKAKKGRRSKEKDENPTYVRISKKQGDIVL